MEKPITMRINEFKRDIANITNESSLPPFILESVFKDFYNDVRQIAIQTAKNEENEYLNGLSDNTEQEILNSEE